MFKLNYEQLVRSTAQIDNWQLPAPGGGTRTDPSSCVCVCVCVCVRALTVRHYRGQSMNTQRATEDLKIKRGHDHVLAFFDQLECVFSPSSIT